jgi:uncharacterized protein (DUF2062 family)
VRAFIHARLVEPLVAQLKVGATPARLALALALGGVVGMLPVLGVTTGACLLLGLALRLNQPALQVANYAAYPLQLALLIPFFQAGARLFGQPPLALTLAELRAEVSASPVQAMGHWLGATLRAVAAWALVAPLLGAALFLALRWALSRVPARR